MKHVLLFFFISLISFGTLAKDNMPAAEPDVSETYQDVQKNLGLVPSFLKKYPKEGVAAAWDEMKLVQLNPKSAIPNKYKELIGMGVAAQIPCEYCEYFHTKAATKNGATERERNEALAIASLTRHWSTIFYGMQVDQATFKKEFSDMMAMSQQIAERQKTSNEQRPQVKVTNYETALKDIENTFGSVPNMFKQVPDVALAPLWLEMKNFEMNPNTAIPNKYKSLIGLAVASQVPCNYCTFADTESAKAEGATQSEVKEAVAMAAIVRRWSTVLNGSLIDKNQFRKEADQIFRYVDNQAKQELARGKRIKQ